MAAANKIEFNAAMIELKADLRGFPPALQRDATAIVYKHAEAAKTDIQQAYPQVSGNLARGMDVITKASDSKLVARAVVKNRAPHATLFEKGTEARHYFTEKRHVMHATGKMPAGNIFIPRAMRHRAAMIEELIEYVKATGLKVEGNAAA